MADIDRLDPHQYALERLRADKYASDHGNRWTFSFLYQPATYHFNLHRYSLLHWPDRTACWRRQHWGNGSRLQGYRSFPEMTFNYPKTRVMSSLDQPEFKSS